MEAKRQVMFQTDTFFGRADFVKFDEADDIVIFQSDPATRNLVTITKILPNGQPGQVIRGSKIRYDRKTGSFGVDGGRSIEGQG